jgi:hypothetical protein
MIQIISHNEIYYNQRISRSATQKHPPDNYLEIAGIEKQKQQILKRRLRPRLEEMLDLPVDLVLQDYSESLTLISKIAREQGKVFHGRTPIFFRISLLTPKRGL